MKKARHLSGCVVGYVVLILLCLVIATCSPHHEEALGPGSLVPIDGRDLTSLVTLPQAGNSRQTTVTETTNFTAGISWQSGTDWDDEFTSFSGVTYSGGTFYRAVLALTAKEGFTFDGTDQNSFTHTQGETRNPAGSDTTLNVTITFPVTSFAGDQIVTETNLATVLEAPVKGQAPQTTIECDQYTGAVSWTTESGGSVAGNFAPATVYRARIPLTPQDDWTLAGLESNSFTYGGAQVSYNIMTRVVTVTFPATVGENEDTPVNSYNLTDLLTAPVHRQAPKTTFENNQYEGSVAWSYSDNAPVGAEFDCDKVIKAVVTLTAKTDFTFTGVLANVFVHNGSSGISNAADSGTVTVTFSALDWKAGAITYPVLAAAGYNAVAYACCWPGNATSANRPAVLVNQANLTGAPTPNNNHWDYAWNGTASQNSSSWRDIIEPAGASLDGDESGGGHPSAFLTPTVPEAIRKRAHVFTIDLGAVRDNIVSFGIFPRQNESVSERGERWPVQFEVFYSDEEIGPIFEPGVEATSLGIFDWENMPYPFEWRDVELYPNTENGRPFSARYIHFRIYAEQRNGPGAAWICPSFAQVRIGVSAE